MATTMHRKPPPPADRLPPKGNPLMSAPASPTMTVEQDRLYRETSALLATLNEVVPASTVHFAVEDARRALHQLLTKRAKDTE